MTPATPHSKLLQFPEPMTRAAASRAERQAILVGIYLEAIGVPKPVRLSRAVLLELAAILELALWEQQGLHQHIDAEVPTVQEATGQFIECCAKGPAESNGSPGDTSLSLQVFRIAMENLAWDGLELLGVDVALGDFDDEEAFIDALADLLWSHRHN